MTFKIGQVLTKEEWRDVVGYEGLYKISSTGRVLSKWGGWKERTPQMLKSGYLCFDFYKNAKSLGSSYSRTGHHYWDSNCELAARAFACYVKDKSATQGYMNDYLCGHAEDKSDDGTLTYPVGEERKAINKAFDALFAELRKSFFKC